LRTVGPPAMMRGGPQSDAVEEETMPVGHPGRVFREKVSIRFSGAELAEIEEAVRLSPVAWKGKAHHLRQACLDWARAGIATAAARDGRHKSRRKAAS
jgi:hypothetical protein